MVKDLTSASGGSVKNKMLQNQNPSKLIEKLYFFYIRRFLHEETESILIF